MEEQALLEEIRKHIKSKDIEWVEKKMFGGVCFLVDNKMCFGTTKGQLLVRIDPQETDELTSLSNVKPMIHGKRVMNGYLFVPSTDYASNKQLSFWIDKCLEFNPKAKSSKK